MVVHDRNEAYLVFLDSFPSEMNRVLLKEHVHENTKSTKPLRDLPLRNIHLECQQLCHRGWGGGRETHMLPPLMGCSGEWNPTRSASKAADASRVEEVCIFTTPPAFTKLLAPRLVF